MAKRAFVALALIAAVTLIAVACGDDLTFPGKVVDTPTPSATETPGGATPTPTATPPL